MLTAIAEVDSLTNGGLEDGFVVVAGELLFKWRESDGVRHGCLSE
jgi:hypothetical protein